MSLKYIEERDETSQTQKKMAFYMLAVNRGLKVLFYQFSEDIKSRALLHRSL